MFYTADSFPFVKQLEAQWQLILMELQSLPCGQFQAWPETALYNQGWDVFGFYFFGQRLAANCAQCPQTLSILETIPGLTTAGFSCLAPATHIKPHTGYTDSVLRLHLGLLTPPECGLRVGAEVRNWQAGECLIFDDTVEHEAWNYSSQPRVILLLDFMKSGTIY